jgi:4-amino-4-deoxy-L-arabinose transferase-like glycosyltransferase
VLVRDILAWVITAAVLLLLLETSLAGENKPKQKLLMAAIGFLLGLGYLARETFLIIIPLVLVALGIQAVRQRNYSPIIFLICALLAAVSPLVARNLIVGAPPLSSSNRFAEGFIMGNAHGAMPNRVFFPPEMKPILQKTGGRPGQVIVETIKTHPNLGSFLRLQTSKALSLFDPYEPCDNMSVYFMENFSPPVKWGLRHWMLIVPGVAGLILSLRFKDKRHFWLWLIFAPLLVGVLIGTPISRYRQSLMILWIPWAAYFLITTWRAFYQNRRLAWTLVIAVVLGWAACLTVFARVPKTQYERPWEYLIAISVYRDEGQTDKAEAMKQLFREKFPDQESWLNQQNGTPGGK